MSQYTAPLKDMCFVIRELAGLSEVTALPGHGEVNAELVDAVLGEAAKFAQEVLDPLNREGDKQGSRLADGRVTTPPGFKEAYRKFIDAGWNGLAGAPEFGGQGLPHIIATPVQEIWKSANLAFCLCPMLTSGVLEALKVHASPEQKSLWVPKLTSGEWSGTMNLTEPQAGSDLSAVRSRGARVGCEGFGESGVSSHCLIIERKRFPQAHAPLERAVLGTQIIIVSLEVGSGRACHPLALRCRRLNAKRFGNFPTHLVLDRKHPRCAAIEAIGPQIVASSCVDELRI